MERQSSIFFQNPALRRVRTAAHQQCRVQNHGRRGLTPSVFLQKIKNYVIIYISLTLKEEVAMDERKLMAKAIEEYRNFGIITPRTEKLLLKGNSDPEARAKLWRKIASVIIC